MTTLRHALFLLVLAGCVTTKSIQPADLARLDGYGVVPAKPPQPELETLTGARMTLSPGANIYLDVVGQRRVGGRFESIQVRDGIFQGRTTKGDLIQVPVDRVTRVDVYQYSPGHTYALIAGALFVVLAGSLVIYTVESKPTSNVVVGRPLRLRGALAAAPLGAADGWQADGPRPDVSSLSGEARAALEEIWGDAARAEHASVPAFSRLSLTLAALGAPAQLIEGAHRAALDEIEHARLSFGLAGAYAGTTVAVGGPSTGRNALPNPGGGGGVDCTPGAGGGMNPLVDGGGRKG